MIEDDDRKLVEDCLSGKTEAFSGILDRYERPVYNLAYRMVGNSEDAVEVTQIVFIKAFENLDTYNSAFRFFTWIYRIAVNESINFRKSRKQFETLVDRDLGGSFETPETKYVSEELNKSLLDAIGSLKEDYRAVIILRHLQELSYEEISEVLDISTKQVKSRLFTARTQLRELLTGLEL
jgi:RNA polymerase sigma-70 factor (ECF subfamily)